MKIHHGVAAVMIVVVAAVFGAAAVTRLQAQPKPPIYVVIEVNEMLDARSVHQSGLRSPDI